jgi:hypothetical protein
MTFRLRNHGLEEHWLEDEFLYHTWHPGASGANSEYHGPHDGAFVSLHALESHALGRVLPLLENPWIARVRQGRSLGRAEVLQALADGPEPGAPQGVSPRMASRWVWWIERHWEGFNVFYDGRRFHGVPCEQGVYDPARKGDYRPLLSGATAHRVRQLIRYYNRLPGDFWGKFWAEPLHKLPWRACAKAARRVRQLIER